MIGIKIISTGEYLDLDSQVQIPFRIIFPAFSSEIGDNTHSLQFDIPATRKNTIRLNHANRIHTYNPLIEHDAQIEVGNFPFLTGKLFVDSGTFGSERIRLTFEADLSVVAPDLKSTKLRDIDLGGIRVIGTSAFTTIDLQLIIDDDNGVCALEVNGFVFYVLLNPTMDEEDVLTNLEGQINGAANNATASTAGTGASTTLTITATTGNLEIDLTGRGDNEQTFVDLGAGSGSTIHAAILAHMKLTYIDAIGTHDYQFLPVYNPNFYDGQNGDYLGYVNLWDYDADVFVANSSASGEAWRNTAVPFPRVQYLFKQVLTHLGLTDITSYARLDGFDKLCLWNNVSLDEEGDDGGGAFNQLKSSFNLRDHVPDWTCAEFINELRKYNLSFDVDWERKEAKLFPKVDIPGETRTDWTNKSSIQGELKRAHPKDRGYLFSWEEDKNDELFDFSHPTWAEVQVLEGATSIVGKTPPMLEANRMPPGKTTELWEVPWIQSIGKTTFANVEDPGFIPRMFLFLGQKEAKTTGGSGLGLYYPFGTSYEKDSSGTVVAPFGLSWSTVVGFVDNGIYETWWKSWVDGREDQPELSTVAYLNLADLLRIKKHAPVWMLHETAPYPVALKQIDITITQERIRPAQLVGLRL